MIRILAAGVPVEIENRWSPIARQCEAFYTDAAPVLAVSVTDADLEKERAASLQESPSDAALESIAVYRKLIDALLPYDVLMMHAAIVVLDGQAVAFAAPSGTGKTTHARLWCAHFGRRAEILNGDKPLLRVCQDGFWAYGTPWKGKENLGTTGSAPLRAVCFLEQGAQNAIRSIGGAETLCRLVQQVLIPAREPELSLTLGLVDRLMEQLPFYVLSCTPEESAVCTVYDRLKSEGFLS